MCSLSSGLSKAAMHAATVLLPAGKSIVTACTASAAMHAPK